MICLNGDTIDEKAWNWVLSMVSSVVYVKAVR